MPQPVQSYPAHFLERKLASATTGTSLSTTAAFISIPFGSTYMSLIPRNYSTAVVVRWLPMPYLVILKNQDALVTEPIDCSYLLQDGDNTVTNVINSFDTLANGDAFYIASLEPFRGLHIDVQNTNGSANDMTAVYSRATSLATLTITDNTDTGASLAQDGTVTWTVPTDWSAQPFNLLFNTRFHGAIYEQPLYWIRLAWSAAVDSSTSLNQIRGLNRSTAYLEIPSGMWWDESIVTGLPQGGPGFWPQDGCIAGIEALTDAGTANLLVEVASTGRFPAVASVAL